MKIIPCSCIHSFRGLATSFRSAGLRAGLFSLFALCALAPKGVAATAEVRVDLSSGWTGNNGREFPGAVGDVTAAADGKQVAIAYDFSNGGQYVAASRQLEKVEALATVKLKVVGPGHMSVGLKDASGQDFLFHVGMTASDEQSYTLNLAKPSKSWGGAEDKVMHFPLRSIRILANKKPEMVKGALVIKEILLVRAP